MSNFKHKNSKKIIEEKRITLDAKHNIAIENLQNQKNEIPRIEEEIRNKKSEIKKLENEQSFMRFEKIHDLQMEIKELKKRKKRILKNKDRKKYLLKSGKLMFDYYQSMNSQEEKQKKMNQFFNIKQDNDELVVNDKQRIIEKYNELNENNYKNKNFIRDLKTYYSCPECKHDLKIINQEAIMFCEGCGYSRPMIIDMIKPSYKDPPKEAAYFNYKRINHFNEWLAQFQAKETTEIPRDVYDQIKAELKKQRIDDKKKIALLSRKKLRQILKKLGLNKYYEHIPHIINRLNGIPAPRMSRQTEEILRNMFKEIQFPFIKHCPPDRKNFMSYSYVLHKFCEILGLSEFLHCFPLLKSREKLYDMDQIWRKICVDLDWEFYPSI
jgi:DNA-directed RNA polymerase subunit RPC12/RpoP